MAMIDRAGASSLIPEAVSNEIINGVRKNSTAMQLMRRLPNMTTATQRQPVLSMLPVADFVDGDQGMKITTSAAWDKKTMVAGEIATIVPIPQAVLDDANYDIWGQVRPLIEEAFGRVFDNQVFNGGNPKAPSEWPTALIPAAKSAGKVVAQGTGTDVAADISSAMALLEEESYDINGIAAQMKLRASLRDLRNSNGDPIYTPMTSEVPGMIYSVPSHFVTAGAWQPSEALAILGDWNMAAYSIRQDITYQVFDTGVISDDTGKIVYNLLQQDMVAMRAVMRIAWQVANPIDIDRSENAYPFAVLTPADPNGGNGGD